MATTTAVLTAPFDPPVRHHRRLAETLTSLVDQLLIIPSGPKPRRSKPIASTTIHRAAMTDLTFRGLPRVTVDLDDLEHDRFTPHHEIEAKLRAKGDSVTFVVPLALLNGGRSGQSFIHREWQNGSQLWQNSHFTIIRERGQPFDVLDAPPRNRIIDVDPHLPSESVRLMLLNDEPADDQLVPAVRDYIRRRGLYRDTVPDREANLMLNGPRLVGFPDPRNPRAIEQAQRLQRFAGHDPELLVTFGGDGTMLRAIRSRWRDRVPFFGVNLGGQGFLLNGREPGEFWTQHLIVFQLPLLHIVTEFRDGHVSESLAFNDAWVERATGQTAWLKVSIDGVTRVPKLVGDGLLVATAAGSSSYARAMGATPVPLNTEVLVLAGSNVYLPAFWKPALLPTDSIIEIETLDPDRRPLRAAIDGYEESGPVRKMTARVSRTASAELAFLPDHDPVAKLAYLQFPDQEGINP